MKDPDVWDPQQYERFREQRLEPGRDLLALVRPRPGMRAIDLGCGTGELTLELHRRLDAQATLGIDNSEAMLARARERAVPGLRFERADIHQFAAEAAYDLVFSNAALHWIGDHAALIPRLCRALSPEGQLAVQVPINDDHPAHEVAFELAQEDPFRGPLAGFVRTTPVLAPERYTCLLAAQGFKAPHVRLQVYTHWLEGPEGVIDWVKGTLLTDYQRRLGGELFEAFLLRYRSRLLARLSRERPFLLTYKRILFWAQLGR